MGKGGGLKTRVDAQGTQVPFPLVSKGLRSEGGSKCLSLEGLGALWCYHFKACPLPMLF